MPRRSGASIAYDQPAPHNRTNDMVYSFIEANQGNDGQYFAPLGKTPNSWGGSPTLAFQNVLVMNVAGTFTNLLVKGNTNAATVTQSWTVVKNGVDTAIVASTVIGSAIASDTTHSFSCVPGDEISIGYALTGSDNFSDCAGSLYFTPA